MKNEIEQKELISMSSIKWYKLYKWFRAVMEQAGNNTWFENDVQQNYIVTRIMKALWRKYVPTLELEFEENRRLMNTAER